MMKVLLLGFGKIAYMPYMNFYLDTLKEQDIQFELIYWDRDGKPDAEVPQRISKAYKFEEHLEEQLPFKNKLKYFAKYRRFALNVLSNNSYDRIIVLHTTPGLTLPSSFSVHSERFLRHPHILFQTFPNRYRGNMPKFHRPCYYRQATPPYRPVVP